MFIKLCSKTKFKIDAFLLLTHKTKLLHKGLVIFIAINWTLCRFFYLRPGIYILSPFNRRSDASYLCLFILMWVQSRSSVIYNPLFLRFFYRLHAAISRLLCLMQQGHSVIKKMKYIHQCLKWAVKDFILSKYTTDC